MVTTKAHYQKVSKRQTNLRGSTRYIASRPCPQNRNPSVIDRRDDGLHGHPSTCPPSSASRIPCTVSSLPASPSWRRSTEHQHYLKLSVASKLPKVRTYPLMPRTCHHFIPPTVRLATSGPPSAAMRYAAALSQQDMGTSNLTTCTQGGDGV
jgi:hypothetical protein